MCPSCQALTCEWVKMSGRGTIYSFVICCPPVLPAFAARAPFPVVLVAIAEDPSLRVLGNLVDAPGKTLRIGAPVQVIFEEVTSEVTLPQWRLS
jgi:uncharacterized OB-fold protein